MARWLMLEKPIQFPRMYSGYIALATLDVLLTTYILHNGGREANPVAAWVIEQGDVTAMAFFKYATVFVVLISCEWIAASNFDTGRRVARGAIALSVVPIVMAMLAIVQLSAGWWW